MYIRLKRPIVALDLETTGTTPGVDRIIEIGALKLSPGGRRLKFHTRVKPGIRIPPEATAVHGISDDDVEKAPRFRLIARRLLQFLEGSDLLGFNLAFDLEFLKGEFKRARMRFSAEGRNLIDCMTIFHRKERRNLSTAVRFYCRKRHEEAHSALADARACLQVLEGQLKRYRDLPKESEGLHDYCNDYGDRFFDSGRKFQKRYGQPAFAFGKYKGHLLRKVVKKDPRFLNWMLGQDFPPDTLELVRAGLDGGAKKK